LAKNLEEFSRLLRHYLKERALTLDGLRECLNAQGYDIRSPGTISKWANGKNRPAADVVEVLEDIFSLRRGELLRPAGYFVEAVESYEDSPLSRDRTGPLYKSAKDVLVQDALKKHFEDLLGVVPEWKSMLAVVPSILPGDVDPHGNLRPRIPVGRTANGEDFLPRPQLELEETLLFELLRQHLDGHQILKDYEEWKQLADSLRGQCSELFRRIYQEGKESIEAVLQESSTDESAPSREFVDVLRQWDAFVSTLRGLGESGNLDAYLRNACEPVAIEEGALVVGFYYPFHKEVIEELGTRRLLEEKMAETFGTRYELRCVLRPRELYSANWPDAIYTDSFARSVYQYVTGREKIETQIGEVAYKIEPDTSGVLARLVFGDALLAYVPLHVAEALGAAHKPLVQKYACCPEVEHIAVLEKRLLGVAEGLRRQFDILLAKRIIPGQCDACPV